MAYIGNKNATTTVCGSNPLVTSGFSAFVTTGIHSQMLIELHWIIPRQMR